LRIDTIERRDLAAHVRDDLGPERKLQRRDRTGGDIARVREPPAADRDVGADGTARVVARRGERSRADNPGAPRSAMSPRLRRPRAP
jgi:hypothetical protein